jgi:putative transposase
MRPVKLIAQVKLLPSPEQADALLRTLEVANAAATAISTRAWSERTFRQFDLHRLVYADTRVATGLAAQMVVRLIAKVADAYTLDRNRPRAFRPRGSIAYDDRILRYGSECVSIWTVDGRQAIPFVCGDRQRQLLTRQQGESDLVYRDGAWYLLATVVVAEPPQADAGDWIGVDLGVVNVAVDSDGVVHAGGPINGLRRRNFRLRKKLQGKRTQSAKRLLKRRRRKEQRQANDINHCISKRIVRVAERTQRGIVFEDLKHIRSRIRARRSQRRTLHSWAFGQLQAHTVYKARLAGVPVQFVDPAYSSQTCPACGFVAKTNRPSQGVFQCGQCGLVGLPDHFAALTLRDRGRAVVSLPDAGGVVSQCAEAPTCKPLTSVRGS